MNTVATVPSTPQLGPLISVVELLRDLHPDMTLNTLHVFLLVAANPGISQREIMDRTGLADSSASRIVAMLSEYGNRGTGPFFLVELVPSKEDRRFKSVYLTKKGHALVRKIVSALKG